MIDALCILLMVVFWMAGGQYDKALRRFGCPTVILFWSLWRILHGQGIWWHYIPLFILFPEFALGYGPGSWATKIFVQEAAIRFAYASFLYIPIAIVATLNLPYDSWWTPLFTAGILIGSFQIHAGSAFKIGKKDFLIEDLCRSLALGICLKIVI